MISLSHDLKDSMVWFKLMDMNITMWRWSNTTHFIFGSLIFSMECKLHALQHMPWTKKNYDKISTPHNLAMVHPTTLCLPWTINMLRNARANIIQKKDNATKNKKTMYNLPQCSKFLWGIIFNQLQWFPMWHMWKELCLNGTQPLHQIFTCLPTCDDPNN
jgi:hypothetical protein